VLFKSRGDQGYRSRSAARWAERWLRVEQHSPVEVRTGTVEPGDPVRRARRTPLKAALGLGTVGPLSTSPPTDPGRDGDRTGGGGRAIGTGASLTMPETAGGSADDGSRGFDGPINDSPNRAAGDRVEAQELSLAGLLGAAKLGLDGPGGRTLVPDHERPENERQPAGG